MGFFNFFHRYEKYWLKLKFRSIRLWIIDTVTLWYVLHRYHWRGLCWKELCTTHAYFLLTVAKGHSGIVLGVVYILVLDANKGLWISLLKDWSEIIRQAWTVGYASTWSSRNRVGRSETQLFLNFGPRWGGSVLRSGLLTSGKWAPLHTSLKLEAVGPQSRTTTL
jgi:hypothetical protein